MASPVLEDKVFCLTAIKAKWHCSGVEERYNEVIEIDSLIVSGNWFANDFNEVVLGGGIARNLSLGVYDYTDFYPSQPQSVKEGRVKKNPFINETVGRRYFLCQ